MYYVPVDGNVRIAVYDLNPAGLRTVVMVHGWPLSAAMYEYQARILADRGFRVITMDLRGFGRSDAPACGYCYDRLSDDVYQVVRALRLRRFILVGFSMGGAIALRYMRRRQGFGVCRLALLAAAAPRFTRCQSFPYGLPRSTADSLIELAQTDRPQLAQNFSRQLLACPHSEAVKDWFRDLALTASGIGMVKTAYALRDEDGCADLEWVRVPTGIFHGKKDQIVPYELGLVQKACIPDASLFTFDASGHGVFYDELERFNRQFVGFLEE